MPRPRFTIRRMMVAVAVVGASLGFIQLRRLAKNHDVRAAHHARQEAALRACLDTVREEVDDGGYRLTFDEGTVFASGVTSKAPLPFGLPGRGVEGAYRTRDGWSRLAAWRGELRRKYERLARYPWLPVAPDPPIPE
jgi:hypothetical protein